MQQTKAVSSQNMKKIVGSAGAQKNKNKAAAVVTKLKAGSITLGLLNRQSCETHQTDFYGL